MKKALFCFTFLTATQSAISSSQFETFFEQTNGAETATYQQVIHYYQKLSHEFDTIQIQTFGETDSGKPLHLVIFNKDGLKKIKPRLIRKSVLLINNGIHPGESDGIDATMMLFRDLASGKIPAPENVIIATIPIYNIGGSLNRNSTSRTNQNGPREYGFRGNARNYDLNRDFIKCDTKNCKAFTELLHQLKPDVFIDNHVSNGADYQYTLTHLFTQHNKLRGKSGEYLQEFLMPELEKKLKLKNWDITPYVNVFNDVPEKGFNQFMDYPRYSTGYTTLFNTLGMMVETHMLKPYKQRVEGTYQLMLSMIEIMQKESDKIITLRQDFHKEIYNQDLYTLNWQIDGEKSSMLNFKGFEGEMIDSKVTNQKRLKYDRTKPFNKAVKFQNYFKPALQITMPKAYIIPQGWHNVIDLLKLNNVAMNTLDIDSDYQVESYRITDYETSKTPYEGHYPHSNTQISKTIEQKTFKKGDYIIEVNQPSIRYILETLEPQAPDSFFKWNFFDTILQQKEHFSPYVFEDIAEQMLKDNPEIAKEFREKQDTDKEFAENWYAQLDWLHKHSKHYEKTHMLYPVYRILK
ncbi:MAG: M14 family metallopeptidase [Gammaproteobacteria bacterium]